LVMSDTLAMTEEEVTAAKAELKEICTQHGEPDEKGSYFLYFPRPLAFTDHTGKRFLFTAMKAERHLTPANPTPDPVLAEALLRKVGCWLTQAQQETLDAIAQANPYVRITVAVEPDALAMAVFRNIITERSYRRTLRPQQESFQFRRCE